MGDIRYHDSRRKARGKEGKREGRKEGRKNGRKCTVGARNEKGRKQLKGRDGKERKGGEQSRKDGGKVKIGRKGRKEEQWRQRPLPYICIAHIHR
jgi:hypothetical protein